MSVVDRCGLVVVGASWGGLRALERFLDHLPDELTAPVVVAQHRGEQPSALASLLRPHTARSVAEATDKEPLTASVVRLAPPGYHLLVERHHLALSLEEPVQHSRPSVDVLFESAALAYARRTVAVVLTGANGDGSAGVRSVAHRGGAVLVQDPDTAERSEMPRAAIATGVDAIVAPVEEMGEVLLRLCATSAEAS